MTEKDQEFMKTLSESTFFDARGLEFESTPEAQQDISWVWNTFGLKKPDSYWEILED
ncbi:hypothetical protein IH980_00345 [Patescibacteria group bacterium]|nr:hypothetical protein [Patescibacteria group bacterium]